MLESIKDLCIAHEYLCKDLAAFELKATVSLIADLETIPSLHANRLRIEILLNLALASCIGRQPPNKKSLIGWLRKLESSPYLQLEDPVEDSFVDYICTETGGFRMFASMFSGTEFSLQRLVDLYEAKSSSNVDLRNCFKSALELLKLSELLVEKTGIARYSLSQSILKKRIPLEKLSKPPMTTISKIELDCNDINRASLSGFILQDEQLKTISEKPFYGSPLERYPLLNGKNGGLVIASPAFIGRAALNHLARSLSKFDLETVDSFLQDSDFTLLQEEVLTRIFNFGKWEMLPPAPNLPHLNTLYGHIDRGIPIMMVSIHFPLADGRDLEATDCLDEEQIALFEDYLQECASQLESATFDEGIILISTSSNGRPVTLNFNQLPDRWTLIHGSLIDWRILSFIKKFDGFTLWQLARQLKLLESLNVEIQNPSGLLNLYGYWESSGFSLIPKEIPIQTSSPKIISIGCGHEQEVENEVRSFRDVHVVPSYYDSGYLRVERMQRELHPDTTENRRYVSRDAINAGLLLGFCPKTEHCSWWVSYTRSETSEHGSGLIYRLWDCIFGWLERAGPFIEKTIGANLPGSIHIRIITDELSNWDPTNEIPPSEDVIPLQCEVDFEKHEIAFTITTEFLRNFHQSENIGEQEIIRKLVSSSSILAGASINEQQLDELVCEIIGGTGARFFHLMVSNRFEINFATDADPSPQLVPLEGRFLALHNLSGTSGLVDVKTISDRKEILKFMFNAVVEMRERIVKRMESVDLISIVRTSYQALDEISRDESRWEVSSRALLSLHNNAPWVLDEIRRRTSLLDQAEIANRIIIETAMYSTCSPKERKLTKAEHLLLLADIAAMNDLGNYCDSIQSELVDAHLTVYPNGYFRVTHAFQDQVLLPLWVETKDGAINDSAARYDHFFHGHEEDAESKMPQADIDKFWNVFHAEFGLTGQQLGRVVDFLQKTALKHEAPGILLPENMLKAVLSKEVGISAECVIKFMDRFILPTRKAWDKEIPSGLEDQDVYPWRFWRGLSFLLRPFVQVSKEPGLYFISTPQLDRWVCYLVNSITSGSLPERLFSSAEMISYLGHIADKRGAKFTQEVADKLRGLGYVCLTEVKMTRLGAEKMPDLGDIDVLAWDSSTSSVFCFECKSLKKALTHKSIVTQLEDFRGDLEKMDYLGKHKRRMAWVRTHLNEVSALTELEGDFAIHDALVTSNPVPMKYYDGIDFPKEGFVPLSGLDAWQATIIAG